MVELNNNFNTTGPTTSTQKLNAVTGSLKRIQLIISYFGTNQLWIGKGDQPIAQYGSGIFLLQNGTYLEASVTGFECTQQAIQILETGAGGGQIGITEVLGDGKG